MLTSLEYKRSYGTSYIKLMKIKLVVLSSVLALGLLAAVAFADNSTSTEKKAAQPVVISTTTINCVGTAVNLREITLDAAVQAHQTAITNAYTARATALKAAYSSSTSPSDIRKAVKSAWSAFGVAIKSAAKDWRNAQKSAWSNYRTAIKACRAPGSIGDNEHSGAEISGN